MSKIKIILIIAICLIRVQTFAIAQEQQADEMLRDIIETFATLSPAQQQGQLEDAGEVNDDIDQSETQDYNEFLVNKIYLKLSRYGIDSLNDEDSIIITSLAPQCPYIGGNAVFKARNLNGYYHPSSMYDDIKLCNQAGVYKVADTNSNNGKSRITLENEYLQKVKPPKEKALLNIPDFILYPNPTDGKIIVQYDLLKDATLEVLDIIGRTLMTYNLSKDNNTLILDVTNLSNGVYIYKCNTSNQVLYTGKIIKQ